MSRVQLEPSDPDGVMERKAVSLDNAAVEKYYNVALFFFFFK